MRLSVVIPVLNEAPVLKRLLARLEGALEGIDWEAIFVNDGSTDGSLALLRAAARKNRRVKVLSFPRNFGQQAAITAGLDFAEGDGVAVMDADLQDPPELLPQMLELLGAGYDVVSGRRVRRCGETPFKRCSAALFYRVLAWVGDGRLNPEVGEFRLLSRRAVLGMRAFRERYRFVRGLVSWLGLKETTLPFERPGRAEGETKYSLPRMIRLAWTAITSFSSFPLRLTMAAGAALSAGGLADLFWNLQRAFQTQAAESYFRLSIGVQLFLAGLVLLAVGVAGDYVARNYEESKRRPLYVVTDLLNISEPGSAIEGVAILKEPDSRRLARECRNIEENDGRMTHVIQRR